MAPPRNAWVFCGEEDAHITTQNYQLSGVGKLGCIDGLTLHGLRRSPKSPIN
jgi:hypothetical protein